MKYKARPLIKEAMQFLNGDGPSTLSECLAFTGKGVVVYEQFAGSYYINTLEGKMLISDGDYIVKGIKGEFYPCKPDIFEMTYEPFEKEGKE